MDNTQLQYIKIQSQYIDKLEQFEKCIIKAAKAAHSLADTAEKKCGQAWAALESGNMDVMRNTIQQYISRYGQDWARFRGVQIQRIDDIPMHNSPLQTLFNSCTALLHWYMKTRG